MDRHVLRIVGATTLFSPMDAHALAAALRAQRLLVSSWTMERPSLGTGRYLDQLRLRTEPPSVQNLLRLDTLNVQTLSGQSMQLRFLPVTLTFEWRVPAEAVWEEFAAGSALEHREIDTLSGAGASAT